MGISLRQRLEKLFTSSGKSPAIKGPVSQKSLTTYAWTGAGFPVYNNSDVLTNVNEGYVGADDVYSIVRRLAKTIARIPLRVYRVADEEALKKYQSAIEQKNFSTQAMVRNQFLKTKALELVPDDNPLQKLLDNPNPSYSKTEFREGFHTFLLVTGNAYIHTPLLEFGVNSGAPVEMWLMPSQWTSLQVSDTWPRRVIKYRLLIATLIELDTREVIHCRYFNPQYTFVGNELIGLSPLRAGSKILDRQKSETDYSVNSFQNSGISGIVWNKSVANDDVAPEVLGKMKSDFYTEAAGTTNARKLLFQAGEIGYTAVGLSPVDMEVLKSEIRTFKKLCNLFGVSDRLFNNDATGSEISVQTAYKDLYTNAALPGVYAERDAYNLSLLPKFNKGTDKYFIDADITGINELQDDFKEMAAIFGQLPVMNPAIIAKAFNWDTDDVPDQFFIKQGYQTVEDAMAGAVQPLPIETPDGN